jgi:hypothetical protein
MTDPIDEELRGILRRLNDDLLPILRAGQRTERDGFWTGLRLIIRNDLIRALREHYKDRRG